MIPLKRGAKNPQTHRHRGQGGGVQGLGGGRGVIV